jgi:TonB family protein
MFAAAPEREAVWAQPAPRKGRWRAAALGILMAALFFALGATVGRDTVNRWIGDVGGWMRSQLTIAPAPKVTPPVAPEQTTAADAPSDTTANGPAREDQTQAQSEETPGATSTPAAKSDLDAEASAPNSDINAKTGKRGTAKGGTVRQTAPEPSGAATEHSILVNAPGPGSAPFMVNFSNEAVSASRAIAMSARRSLEILPRSSSASSGAERVVIGKLIVHSEPFYPAEARSRGIEGSVELRAKVGRTGEVLGVTPLSGPWLLFSPAVAAVREWRYEPTYVNGDPVETVADVTIVFRLP